MNWNTTKAALLEIFAKAGLNHGMIVSMGNGFAVECHGKAPADRMACFLTEAFRVIGTREIMGSNGKTSLWVRAKYK